MIYEFGLDGRKLKNERDLCLADPGQQGVTRGRTRPRKHNSVPALSNSFPLPPQPRGSAPPDAPPAASSAEEPATSTEPPAEPTSPSESAARPDALLEELPTADESTVPEQQQDAAVTLPPAPVQPELTNPLPSPPRDVLDSHAYRHLRRAQTSPTTGAWQYHTAPVASVSYKPHLRSQHRAKGTDTLRPPRPHDELIAKGAKSSGGGGGAFKLLRSLTMPVLSSNKTKKLRGSTPVSHSGSGYPYRSFTSSSRNTIPAFSAFPVAGPHVPSGRPITIPLNSPLNPTSRHKITYKRKEYPTAAHLFEAQKFLKHNPELAERIRMSDANAAEMSKLSRAFQTDGMVRGDWELVWRDKVNLIQPVSCLYTVPPPYLCVLSG